MKFSPQTSTLLAVADSRNPKNRSHLVTVTLIAMGLAHAARYNDSQLLARIASAGILHDIGEVYVDPDFFASPHEITPKRWQSFASHPIIGAALVREVAGLDSVCQTAILQHHERVDGIGYPRGVSGKTVSPAANMLGIAEMLSAMLNRDCPVHRVDIALKIVPNEFDPALVSLVGALLEEHRGKSEDLRKSSETTASDIHSVFERIAATLELRHEWEGRHPFSPTTQAAVNVVFERFMRVQRAFASTGMDGLEALLPVLSEAELHEARMEASCVLDEILWRLTRLSRDLALKSLSLPEAESCEVIRLANILSGNSSKVSESKAA